MLSVHGLIPGHYLPKREQSCLDHFIIKLDSKYDKAFIAVLNTSITDHQAIFLSIYGNERLKYKICTKTTVNFEKALLDLNLKNIPEILSCSDPNLVAESLIGKIRECLSKNTRTNIIPRSKQMIKPWMTEG